MLLGDIIKQYRSEHNLSMQNFADLIHSSKSYVSMLEKNFNPSTGKPISPSLETLKLISEAIHIDIDNLLKMLDDGQEIILNEEKFKEQFKHLTKKRTVKIPVLGKVAGGTPIEAISNIDSDEYIEIDEDMAKKGEMFGLIVKGQSMFPYILENDIVVVQKQDDCENGKVAVVMINGDEATVKVVKKKEDGLDLESYNPIFPTFHFSSQEVIDKPIKIIGIVRELRRRNINM